MWDNRRDKRNPKAPDFKCKDRDNCDGAIWLDSKKTKIPGANFSGPKSNGNRAYENGTNAKDIYWQNKDAREAAKDPVIVAQHSQDMALKYFNLTGKPPTSLKDLAAMTDWFFRNAMQYEGAGKLTPATKDTEPDYTSSIAPGDDSGLDL